MSLYGRATPLHSPSPEKVGQIISYVRGDPQDAVGTGPGGSSPIRAPFTMGRRLHFHHADPMVRAILGRARLPDRHDLIPEHSGCQIVFREFTGFKALDSAAVFPLRSDAFVILGRADSNVASTPPGHSAITVRAQGPWRNSHAE